MSHVFVVDRNKCPLDPVHPGCARLLLRQGKAAVFKRYPFTLILKTAIQGPPVSPLRLKLDPGSKVTGMAIVDDATGNVVFAANLEHRGREITQRLDKRRSVRRSRHNRHTRYRQPRWRNRRRTRGWLVPSLESRLSNITTWVHRLRRLCPIATLSLEVVKFDLQHLDNPEIRGVEYQQGTLQGYETREYLLHKWNHQCSYCGKQGIPLQVEHIQPRARGGTDRVSNLCLACETCNQAKGTQDIRDFLKKKPDLLQRLLAQAKAPLTDAMAVNTIRWALYERLKATGLPLECGSGGLTKYNRTRRNLPKEHWIDAANVGQSTPVHLSLASVVPYHITAEGHGRRQMCLMTKRGFPRTGPKSAKSVQGFQTGDMVRAVVSKGKHKGTYVGRVAIRITGSFNVTTEHSTIEGIPARCCKLLFHCDGYRYQHGGPIDAAKKGAPVSSPA